jgi:hypothetical protein
MVEKHAEREWKLLDVMVEEGSMFYFAWHGTS